MSIISNSEFQKHAHYFANLCGSVYLPASMKIDIFGSRSNKNLLLNFLARSIDHWPYDASFRYDFFYNSMQFLMNYVEI